MRGGGVSGEGMNLGQPTSTRATLLHNNQPAQILRDGVQDCMEDKWSYMQIHTDMETAAQEAHYLIYELHTLLIINKRLCPTLNR